MVAGRLWHVWCTVFWKFREKNKKLEAKYLEKVKVVEEILKEKTEAFKCGDKTVEITQYNLAEQDDMLGVNKDEPSDDEQNDDVRIKFLAVW